MLASSRPSEAPVKDEKAALSPVIVGALTAEFENVNFSFTYDGLTVYPKFGGELDFVLDHIEKRCGRVVHVMKAVPAPPRQAELARSEYDVYNKIKSKPHYEDYIRPGEDVHRLYHQDYFPVQSHSHLQFRSRFNRDQLNEILTLFVDCNLIISKGERDEFLARFDKRYEDSRKALDAVIEGLDSLNNKTIAIIKFIQTCTANDILANLHDYLALPKFNYLKVGTGFRGTDASGLIETGEAWAHIEKAVAAQISFNVRSNCRFTLQVGRRFGAMFQKDLPFFGLRREKLPAAVDATTGDTIEEPVSPSFADFVRGDNLSCSRRYAAIFEAKHNSLTTREPSDTLNNSTNLFQKKQNAASMVGFGTKLPSGPVPFFGSMVNSTERANTTSAYRRSLAPL